MVLLDGFGTDGTETQSAIEYVWSILFLITDISCAAEFMPAAVLLICHRSKWISDIRKRLSIIKWRTVTF